MMIREFQLSDANAVQNVLDQVWQNQSSYVTRLSKRTVSAFVAVDKTGVCGYSSLFTNPNHPERDYIGVHILPVFRNHGLGTRLLEALKPRFRAGRKLQTITTFPEAQRFLEHRGFLELMRTYEPMLQVSKANLPETVLPSGYSIETLAAGRFSRLEVARLHAQIYAEQHTWNPTATINDQEMLEDFMDDDVAPEALHLIVFRDQPVAVSSLRGQIPEMDLMWFGVLNSHAEHRALFTQALLIAGLEFARTNGVVRLRAELDSLIPEAMIALESLPFEPCEPWITLIADGIS
jgi:GNAT superfamily N-acetyltransferase